MMKEKKVWDKKNPNPNLVDNMVASRKKGK
jgi:hypothetical protein